MVRRDVKLLSKYEQEKHKLENSHNLTNNLDPNSKNPRTNTNSTKMLTPAGMFRILLNFSVPTLYLVGQYFYPEFSLSLDKTYDFPIICLVALLFSFLEIGPMQSRGNTSPDDPDDKSRSAGRSAVASCIQIPFMARMLMLFIIQVGYLNFSHNFNYVSRVADEMEAFHEHDSPGGAVMKF